MYENGFKEKLDMDKLDVQMTNLQTEKIKVLNGISNGYLGLKVLIGMPVAEPLVLTDTLNYDYIKEGILDNAYNYKDRKEYQYAELGKKLNEYDVKRYKLAQVPTVKLSGSYLKSAQRNEFNFFGKGDWFTISSVSLNISIPIFHGFAAQSRVQQAKIKLQQTENEMAGLKMSIDQEVDTARNAMKTAIMTLDYQKKNIELAENVYNQTRKKYDAGTGSNTEITQAETDLKQAQTNYISAIYDAIVAKIDYLKATGKL
jgi:outer membrane protein TolC